MEDNQNSSTNPPAKKSSSEDFYKYLSIINLFLVIYKYLSDDASIKDSVSFVFFLILLSIPLIICIVNKIASKRVIKVAIYLGLCFILVGTSIYLYKISYVSGSSLKEGDTIYFGSYHCKSDQDSQAIKWKVLNKKDNKALILTENIIETYSFNYTVDLDNNITYSDNITYNKSSLRNWLTSIFYNQIFDKEDQNKIERKDIYYTELSKEDIESIENDDTTARNNILNNVSERTDQDESGDKLFILSATELLTYFPQNSDRCTSVTNYVRDYKDIPALRPYEANYYWYYVRSTGTDGYHPIIVNSFGQLSMYTKGTNENGEKNYQNCGIRPACYISLDKTYQVKSFWFTDIIDCLKEKVSNLNL